MWRIWGSDDPVELRSQWFLLIFIFRYALTESTFPARSCAKIHALKHVVD